MKTWFAVVLLFLAGLPVSAALSLADLRCEGLREASQVDARFPRFSWKIESDVRATRQTACQFRVGEIDGAGRPFQVLRETDRLQTDQSQWVEIPGFEPKARACYAWQVRVWDNHGQVSEWSPLHRFGTGLQGGKWPADWIGDGRTLERFKSGPARYLRGSFKLERVPVRARLYLSAFGLVEPWLNGKPVTQDKFVPGWPDYRHRLFYVAYDVTEQLRTGDNAWGLVLGDGWYSGTILPLHQYGPEPMTSAFIDLTDADGHTTTVSTDGDWRWSEGPITLNSIYDGETYDARRENAHWSTMVGCDWNWQKVSVRPARRVYQTYTARTSPPVRRIERLAPVSCREVSPGVWQYDLGQNMVGWVRLRATAAAGTEITLRFAEMLDTDGRIYTANLRAAKATARYIVKGGAVEEWEPQFTYFGFRYVEVTGLAQPAADAIEGVVVHTALDRVGEFTCSDEWLNKLYRNTLWGQKGNFLELPTDCPQRDERLGWTGDAQVFAPTALCNLDAGRFYHQWLATVRDSLRDGPDGGFGDTAPNTGHGRGSAGWGEAGVIIPWLVYQHTGDVRVLQESLPSIQHAIELMANQAPDGVRRSPSAWGDWLAPGFALFQAPPRYELIATAYYAHAADLAARIAQVVGRPELAQRNTALRDQARAAFRREYVGSDGRIVDDVQTSYLLALAFELLEPAQRPIAVEHLRRKFAEKDNHLATGFLGTPLIAPVLTRAGHTDLAYEVLLQKTYPGWLFSVKNGATTIWERWDSWTPEQGFHKDGMNSFNHYAYGSIVGWFYDTIGGLQSLEASPGWKHFRIAPIAGGGLSSARASVVTPYGKVVSEWRLVDGVMRLSVTVPPNSTAEVAIPSQNRSAVRVDGEPVDPASFQERAGGAVLIVGSGRYEFTLPCARDLRD